MKQLLTLCAWVLCSLVFAQSKISVQTDDSREMPETYGLDIKAVKVKKDQLHLTVSYTGSKTDRIFAWWSGITARSLPPQASVFVQRESADAGVTESVPVTRKLKIDMSALLKNNDIYGVIVRLNGYDTPYLVGAKKEMKAEQVRM
ncbi:MAG: hypothetical protein ACT6QS_06300 [Flavobacteriales bacterium]